MCKPLRTSLYAISLDPKFDILVSIMSHIGIIHAIHMIVIMKICNNVRRGAVWGLPDGKLVLTISDFRVDYNSTTQSTTLVFHYFVQWVERS